MDHHVAARKKLLMLAVQAKRAGNSQLALDLKRRYEALVAQAAGLERRLVARTRTR